MTPQMRHRISLLISRRGIPAPCLRPGPPSTLELAQMKRDGAPWWLWAADTTTRKSRSAPTMSRFVRNRGVGPADIGLLEADLGDQLAAKAFERIPWTSCATAFRE